MNNDILNLFIIWSIGLLNASSILQLWFFSPLKTTLGQLIWKDKVISDSEFDDRLAIISDKLSMLSTCYTCFSFWTSLLIGAIYCLIFKLNLGWPFLCFFSYPPLIWLIKVQIF